MLAAFASPIDAVIDQESHNRPGAVGPMTKYGQALGLSQLLPSTAQGVAKDLGVPYREDLLRGTTPDAATYQRSLGDAYLQQGYRATGNWRDAFRYYHGGPNRALWGPKTNAYADAVMGRLGG